MTCSHCVSAVSAELAKVSGVEDVQVDLASGRVDVISAGPLTIDTVRSAIDEAGYALADVVSAVST